jgi:drug/metabolite transporter (DMT)-like permease
MLGNLIGYLEIIIGQMAYGGGLALAKPQMSVIPIFTFNFVATMSAGVVSLAGSLLAERFSWRMMTTTQWIYIVVLAAIVTLLGQVATFEGLSQTPAITAGIVISSMPALCGILSWLILREKMGLREYGAVALSVLGVALLSVQDAGASHGVSIPIAGLAFLLLGVIGQSMWVVLSKRFTELMPPFSTSTGICFMGALMSLPWVWKESAATSLSVISAYDWGVTVLMGAIGGGLGLILFFMGIRKVKSSHAAMLFAVQPISMTVAAVLFLHESLNIAQGGALFAVLLSIFLIAPGSASDEQTAVSHSRKTENYKW